MTGWQNSALVIYTLYVYKHRTVLYVNAESNRNYILFIPLGIPREEGDDAPVQDWDT